MVGRLIGVVGVVLMTASPFPAAAEIWVGIVEPRQGDFVIGVVDVVVDVVATEKIEAVEVHVDGDLLGVLTSPPYRLTITLDETSTTRRIEVIARGTEGGVATDAVETVPPPVGGEMTVELQQLYVTVAGGGRRVLDLEADEFTILDESVRQELITFARGDIPFTAVVLIDASASMYGEKLRAATAGAAAFVEGLDDLDRTKVMVFSDRLLNAAPFTGDRNVLLTALQGSRAHGGTAVSDHLYVALKLLERRQGRRVVILLSDGVDSHSALAIEDVVAKARRSQVLVYWIRLSRQAGAVSPRERGMHLSSSWRVPSEYRRHLDLLEGAVTESGGRTVGVDAIDQIRPVFVEILRELREQYVLGYYPTLRRNDGSWHRVQVAVTRPGVKVRTHRGYIDF